MRQCGWCYAIDPAILQESFNTKKIRKFHGTLVGSEFFSFLSLFYLIAKQIMKKNKFDC